MMYTTESMYDNEGHDGHWAADPNAAAAAASAAEQIRAYYDELNEGGFLELYRLAHRAFYGLDGSQTHTSSRVVSFGEDGEKLGIRSNQLRSLVKYVYMTVTQSRPTIKPRATNASPKALAQIPVARRVLEYYDRTTQVDTTLAKVALRSLLYAKAYLWQCWDMSAGPLQEGRPSGDLVVRACSPLDMSSDLDADNGKSDWYAGRVRRNKHDLIAMYGGENPEITDKIRDAECDFLETSIQKKLSFWSRKKRHRTEDSVYEYHFMHRATPAVPEGRYIVFLNEQTVLFDGPLPYKDVPVDVMCPEEFLEAGDTGYSSAWDLLGLQDLYDAILSICATNIDAFGTNDILIPEGVEVGYEELRDGLNIIRYPMGEMNKPEVLKKFSIEDGFFKAKDWVKGDMELALSVNSVARGEPEASLESGSALALVQAQAIQAQSPFVAAYQTLIARSGTTRINILKAHMQPDRILAISGSDDPDSVREFKVQDLDQIDRVECESVNPLFQTLAGKQSAADKMLERNMITSPAAYLQFMESGRLDVVTDDQVRSDLFGRRIREILMRGPEVQERPPDPMTGKVTRFVPECRYVITDDPRVCIAAADSVLKAFENRSEQRVLEACLAYVEDVFSAWQSTDPDKLALMGYPIPMSTGAPPPDAGGGAPPGPPKDKPVDEVPPAEGSTMPSLPKPAESPL